MILLKQASIISLCAITSLMTLTLCPRHWARRSWHYNAPSAVHGVQNPQALPASQYGTDGWYRRNGAWHHDGGPYPDTNYSDTGREYVQPEGPPRRN